MSDGKIGVLVAEDSAATRMFLVHLLEADPRIRVVGAVCDGQAAVDFVQRHGPDVVLMDIYMPGLDGFEATRRIMETRAVPIVVCSATAAISDLVVTFQAMQAGALACIRKPAGREHPDFEAMAAHLVATLVLMSEVKVVRRTSYSRPAPLAPLPMAVRRASPSAQVIGIGASTGGPPALRTILGGLPKDFPAPLLVVQHMSAGFMPGMVEWLNQTIDLRVEIASYGMVPKPGHVYVAPDDFHMGVNAAGAIVLTRGPLQHHVRPSVSHLFHSLAAVCGPDALGVLLTGMGRDGAAELKLMRDRGAVTIAQDEESSIVHGMPGVAIALGGASRVLPDDEIAEALIELVLR